jgi:hypothetical protein
MCSMWLQTLGCRELALCRSCSTDSGNIQKETLLLSRGGQGWAGVLLLMPSCPASNCQCHVIVGGTCRRAHAHGLTLGSSYDSMIMMQHVQSSPGGRHPTCLLTPPKPCQCHVLPTGSVDGLCLRWFCALLSLLLSLQLLDGQGWSSRPARSSSAAGGQAP